MKPETKERPFSNPAWYFELKYDGFRMLAERKQGTPCLVYRSKRDITMVFPEIARAVASLPYDLILDGEAVVLDEAGRPSFQSLQRRAHRTRRIDCEQAAVATPATLFAFDLLALEGFDLRPLPLSARKSLLRRVLEESGPPAAIRTIEEIPERGEDLYAAVAELGLEGIVAKRADSPYHGGYSKDWFKIRVDRATDFAVLGFDPVPGSRSAFRSLHLGVRHGEGWMYVGSVGTGFSNQEIAEIRARLEPARRPRPELAGAGPGERSVVWVEPELVCEVRYKEWTQGGHLRLPVFLRLRDDKTALECLPPADLPGTEEKDDADGKDSDATLPPIKFTNLDKVFWPEEGYTKRDLIEYYRSVAPWMLPFLRDRPLVLDRYPNGITGKSFFQKNAAEITSGRLRTVPVRGESSQREIEYFLCDDEDSLLYLANKGAIPLHVWSSRLPDLERPDWCILDLDPKGAPFDHVVRIALAIRGLCEEIALPSFVKTSGGSGLHILLPMGRQLDHERVRQLGELLARVVVDRLPDIATMARAIPARKGKVYVDALQNGRGKLLAAPYSVRPLPGAPVSTPLQWSEVGPRLDVRQFTIRTVPERLRGMEEDPLLPVLDARPDLARSLELLSSRV
ncbi:MAG TPA: DNA ligase D [Thermoanaerobaculia bacterium]